MRTKKFLPILLAFVVCSSFFISGCKAKQEPGETKANTKQANQMTGSAVLKNYPKLDKSDNITGTDTDKNGIRDDIDAYIDSLDNVTKEQRGMLRQSAYASNYILQPTFDMSNPKDIESKHALVNGAVRCSIKLYGDNVTGDRLKDEIDAFIFNTPKRMEVYIKYEKAVDGKVWEMMEGGCNEKFVK